MYLYIKCTPLYPDDFDLKYNLVSYEVCVSNTSTMMFCKFLLFHRVLEYPSLYASTSTQILHLRHFLYIWL